MAECKPVSPEWEFVDELPKGFQTNCPKCSHHLREPFQVTCCENNFCQVCIEGIKKNNGPCPSCGAIEYNAFPNKGLKQSLNQIEVTCCYAKEKCPWGGPLGKLESHLNLNPSQETELDGCQFAQVKCSYNCSSDLILRSELKVHKTEQCLNRPYSCEYCKNYNATYGDVMFHWSQCDHYSIKCPQCHKSVEYHYQDDHIMNDCPETIVQCDYKHFGCDVELPRKAMPTHIDENLALHMKYMSRTVMRLEAEVAEQKKELQYAPVNTILTMDDVEHYKTSGEPWISPSFYVLGYHLYLQVYINVHNVHDEDTDTLCTTVFVCLKQGRFDSNVKWPFQGEITIEMLKEKVDGVRHEVLHTYRITVHEIKPENFNFGRGVSIVHPGLLKHVINNRLHFRVPAVWLTNTN